MTENSQKFRVLIVDDEPEMCRGAQKALQNFNVFIKDIGSNICFETDSAVSKQEFFETIEKNEYDLILLDYKMPEVTGLELLEYIAREKKNTLVIMITAYATFETAVVSTKMGAYDFLAKPFTPEELRNSIKKATTHLVFSRKAQEFEEEKKKIRFKFISVLSHELKAPLNAVDGYLDIMENRLDKISQDDFRLMIGRSRLRLDGMRKLIFDILDLTRIESGEKKRNLKYLDIKELAAFSADLFSEEAAKKNVTIELDVRGSDKFYADRTELEIVLNNLISNAIKYNRQNGFVKIKIRSHEEKLSILVADTGIGISKNDMPKLFQEFSRIKNEQTLHILGSGLGLSTVNKIVKLYNGKVKVKSKSDKGTVFLALLKVIR